MNHDIIIVGAGPAGLSFARSLADTPLSILIIEKASLASIQDPEPDGREIALTHLSEKLMRQLGAWELIPNNQITSIKKASVLDGTSNYSLNFNADSALGYMVSNHLIRKSLYEVVAQQNNVDILTDTTVQNASTTSSTTSSQATVTLSSGEKKSCQLLIAADSRFSDTRRKIGIPARMRDFSRVAIVCRMQHDKPHHDIATECFHYGRTLAVLPLSGNTSSIVITVSTDQANAIVDMSEDDFNRDIEQRFDSRLGAMELVGKRHPYPLVAVHADKFVTDHFALIGDAAVGMHPVTAHGFNLGLRGQHTLATEIIAAVESNKSIASQQLLKRYERKHMMVTRPMYHGTNGLVSLFTNDSPPARLLRSAALRLANNFPPIKHLITNSLTEKRSPMRSL